MELCERLKTIRSDRKLTQKEISDAAGLSINAYQNYELGTRRPAYEAFIAIADILDVSLDYLAGRTDKREVSR